MIRPRTVNAAFAYGQTILYVASPLILFGLVTFSLTQNLPAPGGGLYSVLTFFDPAPLKLVPSAGIDPPDWVSK